MALRPFREYHILALLDAYDKQALPLDLFISHYFREHTALGAKDRGVVADTIYSMVRWQGLIDHLCEGTPNWEKRYEIFSKVTLKSYKDDETIPPHVRCSFPKPLYDLIIQTLGEKKGFAFCLTCNGAAPVTVRVNPDKITRESLLEKWRETFEVSACKEAEYGIVFHKKISFFSTEEFKKGLFEVQDEGSQLLADLMQPAPGQLVLDYCSGSGGKTLAFAHRMKGKGQIYLHDIRPFALMEAKKRLRRAGVQNAQVIQADDEKLKKIKKKMDWVLVDAPCTGTGTLRRNPDMKWKFDPEMLTRLVGQQRTIFEKALSYLKPDGKIVYCTCSVLKEENEEQLAHFIKTYNLKIVGSVFQTLPSEGTMDGFFGVVLERI